MHENFFPQHSDASLQVFPSFLHEFCRLGFLQIPDKHAAEQHSLLLLQAEPVFRHLIHLRFLP